MGSRVKRLLLLAALLPALCPAKTFYLVIAGLGGEPDYEQRFSGLADEAAKAFNAPGGDAVVTELKGAGATKAAIWSSLDQIAHQANPTDALVLLMIGHGSFDGDDYKFNIPGPDLSARELAEMLNRVPASKQLIADTTSASGAVLKPLEHPGRIVVTATRDGIERNATVFARFWIEALHDNTADTDKNESVSALEAFTYAQHKTAKFYEDEKRIATEHPAISDSSRAGLFTVVRFGSAASAAADPAKKHLMAQRDDLEAKIDALKQQKNTMDGADYKKQLTVLLIELAKTQGEIDR
jgi:hypothetical protein